MHWNVFCKARIAGLFVLALAACGGESETPGDPVSTGPATLSGTVVYRERMPMRLGSTIRVRLEDVSLADAPAMVIAEQFIDARNLSIPVSFTLEYDPGRIDERYSYAVRAEIRDAQDQLMWTTTTSHPVLTRGAPGDQVEIMLELVAK
jgi:putative lipoprotein